MTPRPNTSQQRMQQIIEAASQVFAKKGFSKARMDDIAQQAEVSKGTLYLYFKSKDDIITALLNHLFQREMGDLATLQNASGSANERLLQFMEAITANLKTWLQLVPIAYEFLGIVFRRKIVQQTFRQYFRSYLDLVQPIIQQGIDSGEFRPLDAQDIAVAIGAIYEGTILLWVYDPESIEVEKHIRSGMQLLMEGIRS